MGGLILLASIIVYFATSNFTNQNSYIEVKGLSEKIVKSDIAMWSINFEVKSNNIDTLHANVEKNIKEIKKFLVDNGFDDSEISVAPLNIYQNTYQGAMFRYTSNVRMSVYTDKVDGVKEASQKTRDLVKKGIVMSGNYINFNFSDLNSVKPEMIAEATKNAQKSAEDFAENSDSSIGKMVRARQGVFSISEKDPGSPEYKKIRIVSTLRYLLK